MFANKNYYEILGVDREASLDEIIDAYRIQALRWHPDKHPYDRKEAKKRFKDISEAYSVLSDRKQRKKYDKENPVKEESEEEEEPFTFGMANKLFKDFFRDPFDSFEKDFFRPTRTFALMDTEDEPVPTPKGLYSKCESYSKVFSNHNGKEESVTMKRFSETKDGETVTKTKKKTVDPKGNKKIEILEETKDKEGKVHRSEKTIDAPKDKPKQVTYKKDDELPEKKRGRPEKPHKAIKRPSSS